MQDEPAGPRNFYVLKEIHGNIQHRPAAFGVPKYFHVFLSIIKRLIYGAETEQIVLLSLPFTDE